MAKTTFTLLVLLALLTGSAEAGQKVLAVQSISVAPYEQAIRGFEHRYGSEVQRLIISNQKEKDVLRKISDIRPDMILAVGRDALSIATRIKTIPVVYCMALNPRSILAGEKNISGVSMNLPPEKQLSELLKVLPATRNIGLLYDPDQTGVFVQGVRDAAAKLDVNLTATAVRRSRDVPLLLNSMKNKVGVFWMLPDLTVVTSETIESMLLFSLENKTPIITFSEKYLEMGAMLSIGIDPFDIGRQAGEMAQKILSGSDITDAQHVDAREALISLNMKIAEKLGVTIDKKAIGNIRSVR
ncbi:MAG: ABC transporter substrate-binding protein [Deltaproteobacteria bacterium]|nr:ABC transporter substrate-binding protein [Deltaproteobacteria bacterium]